jgi:hypothetical protein
MNTDTHTHTQGPWQIQFWNDSSRPSRRDTPVITTGKDAIGELFNLWDEDGEDREAERLANARLIAAAPEMLAALEELCADKYLADPINADRMGKALAVIAKAKGGEA